MSTATSQQKQELNDAVAALVEANREFNAADDKADAAQAGLDQATADRTVAFQEYDTAVQAQNAAIARVVAAANVPPNGS